MTPRAIPAHRIIPPPRRTSPDTRPSESVQDWIERGNTITRLPPPPLCPDALIDEGVTARPPSNTIDLLSAGPCERPQGSGARLSTHGRP